MNRPIVTMKFSIPFDTTASLNAWSRAKYAELAPALETGNLSGPLLDAAVSVKAFAILSAEIMALRSELDALKARA